jgi:hypothetical protein
MERFVFYANSDWTDTQLNELKTPEPPARFDTDGKQFNFVHIFEAADFDVARLQISRLRFGHDGYKAGDHEHARVLMRKLALDSMEGSVMYLRTMDVIVGSFKEARNRQ